MDAFILNPEILENECISDFTSSHGELEKIMFVNGFDKRCGVLNHYGWYEDVGYENITKHAGEWQHWTIIFDGYIEKVYLNNKLISEKDIQLLIKPVDYITLGRNAERHWPFTGYLSSLRLYDYELDLNDLNK